MTEFVLFKPISRNYSSKRWAHGGGGSKKQKSGVKRGRTSSKMSSGILFGWPLTECLSLDTSICFLCASFFSINLDTSFFFLLSSFFFLLSSFFFLLSSFVLFLLRAPTPLFPPLFPFYSMLSDFLTVSGRHSPPPFCFYKTETMWYGLAPKRFQIYFPKPPLILFAIKISAADMRCCYLAISNFWKFLEWF